MVFCKIVNNEEKKERKNRLHIGAVGGTINYNENVRPFPAGAFLGGVLHVLPVPVWVSSGQHVKLCKTTM